MIEIVRVEESFMLKHYASIAHLAGAVRELEAEAEALVPSSIATIRQDKKRTTRILFKLTDQHILNLHRGPSGGCNQDIRVQLLRHGRGEPGQDDVRSARRV